MPELTSTAGLVRSTWIDAIIALFYSTSHPIEDEENEGYFDGTSEYFDADDADAEDDEPRSEEDEDAVAVEDDEDDLG